MNELTLINAAKRGDVNSFNTLVLTYQDLAYSVAYRILQDQHTAEDATQTAFISAFRKLNQFVGEHFKAWLLRIVTNACYDELRRLKRRPTSSFDDLMEEANADSLPIEDSAPIEHPESIIQRTELQAAIEDCLHQLNDSYRMIAVMVDVEGYSYEEAADMTKISLGTVKSRLSRARLRLRDCLQKYKELLPDQYRLNDEDT